MNVELFTAFVLLTAVLIIAPGPVVTLVISTGILHGPRAAMITVAGTTLGNAILLAAIAFGLGWVSGHAAVVFEALRWTGAAYLVWLGVQAWRHAGDKSDELKDMPRARFVRGLIVALSNPKAIVFFTAFLPQFVDPRLPAGPQLVAMCVASVALAGVCNSGWAVASGYGRAYFMRPERARRLRRFSGLVLMGGGLWLALARRPPG